MARLTLTLSELPESLDVFSGAPATGAQRTAMHLQAIQHVARGILDAYGEQVGRLANYGLTKQVIEYAQIALAWTEYAQARSAGEDVSPPELCKPEDVDRPEFWPTIVYDGEAPLAHFLGLWRWTYGDCKSKPRDRMPLELRQPPKALDTSRKAFAPVVKSGGGASVAEARRYDYEAASRRLKQQVRQRGQ